MKTSKLLISTLFLLFFFTGFSQVDPDTTKVPPIDKKTIEEKSEALKALEEARDEIEDAIEEAKEEMEDAKEDIEDANEELEDAKEEAQDAQEEAEEERADNDEEDIKIKIKIPEFNEKRKARKESRNKKNVRTRYFLVDFGSNIFIEKNDGTQFADSYNKRFEQNIWKSRNWNLHIFRQRINLIKHYVNFEWGLTANFHKFYLTGRDQFTVDINYEIAATNYDNIKLQANYLTLPILLNFETNPNHLSRSFHLTAGGYAGFLMGSNFKHKSDFYGAVKIKDNLGLNKIAYGLMGSVGYGSLNLYGSFNLQSIFEDDKDVNVLSVGIQVFPY